MNLPKLPLPQPLRGSDPNSFAQNTMMVRLPNILRRILAENKFSGSITGKLQTLLDEVPDAHLKHLTDSGAPDAARWSQYIEPYLGRNWLQVPWFLAETCFYRRVLDCTGYFKSGDGYQVDPYRYQKWKGLEAAYPAIARLGSRLTRWGEEPGQTSESLAALLRINLWGNQADYSLWPAGEKGQPAHADLEASLNHIIVDNTQAVVDYICGQRGQPLQIAFIVDNAGFELVSDLALTDFVLANNLAPTVVLHLKSHPTFVSDATVTDVKETIAFLADDSHPDIKQFGQRLQIFLDTNRLQLRHNFFWTSPLSFWEMPGKIRDELGQAALVISKGDANYRRLLGDRHWPYTTPFGDIVSYMPAPLVALRTFKSEVVAGLQPEQLKRLQQQAPTWLSDGKRGVIQFVGN